MANEGQAVIAKAVAPYVVGGIAILVVLWYLNDKFGIVSGISNSLAADNKILGNAATNYGLTQAQSSVDPQVEYDAARSAYAKEIGWSGNVVDVTGWTAYTDWLNGAGPANYTYGSTNYPEAPTPSILSSLENAL